MLNLNVSGLVNSTSDIDFMNGVNFGNVFIPEDFFADNDFYQKWNIPKNADQNSLCDLTGDHAKEAMQEWIQSHIK